MNVQVKLKGFAIDQVLQEPMALLEEVQGNRMIHIPLNVFDLPKILSLHYKVRDQKNDLLQVFHKLHKSWLVRLHKITIYYRNGFVCVATLRICFLFPRKFILSPSDALIFSLITDVPLHVAENAFDSLKSLQHRVSPYDSIRYKEMLEKWNPDISDANIQ
jgi:bifunctional DNase/RNase